MKYYYVMGEVHELREGVWTWCEMKVRFLQENIKVPVYPDEVCKVCKAEKERSSNRSASTTQ